MLRGILHVTTICQELFYQPPVDQITLQFINTQENFASFTPAIHLQLSPMSYSTSANKDVKGDTFPFFSRALTSLLYVVVSFQLAGSV